MIFYTNLFIPKGSAGCVLTLLVFTVVLIRPEYRGDKGLLAHELMHVEQSWYNIIPAIHGLRYRFDKEYRLECEVEAYKEQLAVNKITNFKDGYDYSELYALFISRDYGLDITVEDALTLLKA